MFERFDEDALRAALASQESAREMRAALPAPIEDRHRTGSNIPLDRSVKQLSSDRARKARALVTATVHPSSILRPRTEERRSAFEAFVKDLRRVARTA